MTHHRDGLVPEGTNMPAEPRSASRGGSVPERSWDHWVRSTTFDPVRAIWAENRFLLLLALGYLLLHGLGGWFPCHDSARADLLEERVTSLLRELDQVSERRPVVRDPGKLP